MCTFNLHLNASRINCPPPFLSRYENKKSTVASLLENCNEFFFFENCILSK